MLCPQLCWCRNQNKKAMTAIHKQAGHHFLLHVTSKATTLRPDVTLSVAAKDMHIYVASGAAEDSVCLQYDAGLCNQFPTFRRNFKGLEIRDEVNYFRQSTLIKVEHVSFETPRNDFPVPQCHFDEERNPQDVRQDS
jgi:hypothetical protein